MSVLYLHFDNDDRPSRLARLQKSGAHVVVTEPRWPGVFMLSLRNWKRLYQAESCCGSAGGFMKSLKWNNMRVGSMPLIVM